MENKNNYTMYDFLPKLPDTNRKTLRNVLNPSNSNENRSMYDILLDYLPQLKSNAKNFETWNLVRNLRTLFNGKNAENFVSYSDYIKQIISWLHVSLNPTISVPNRNEIVRCDFSETEKEEFLLALQDATKDDPNCSKFTKIEEFLEYAYKRATEVPQENVEQSKDYKLTDLIIQAGIAVASDTQEHKLRHTMVVAYVADVGNQLREKYIGSNEQDVSEMNRFKFIRNTLTSPYGFTTYENLLSTFSAKVNTFASDTRDKMNIVARRNDIVKQDIWKGLTEKEKAEARNTSLENVLYMGDPYSSMPYTDKIDWEIKAYDNPEVICDLTVDYPEESELDQRVIVVSYGKFHYKMGIADNSIVQPDVIGVTRVGRDGEINSYFAIAPLETVAFREVDEPKIKNGRKAIFVDRNTNKNLYGVVTPKMPTELVDPMVRILFSDYNMDYACKINNFYVGSIQLKEGIPVLNTQDMLDKAALYQATQTPGTVTIPGPDGGKTTGKMTLQKYLQSPILKTLHLRKMTEIVKPIENSRGQEEQVIEEK